MEDIKKLQKGFENVKIKVIWNIKKLQRRCESVDFRQVHCYITKIKSWKKEIYDSQNTIIILFWTLEINVRFSYGIPWNL